VRISNLGNEKRARYGAIVLAAVLICSPMVRSCGASAAATTSSSPWTLKFTGYPSIVAVEDWTFLNVAGFGEFSNLDVVMFAVWNV